MTLALFSDANNTNDHWDTLQLLSWPHHTCSGVEHNFLLSRTLVAAFIPCHSQGRVAEGGLGLDQAPGWLSWDLTKYTVLRGHISREAVEESNSGRKRHAGGVL